MVSMVNFKIESSQGEAMSPEGEPPVVFSQKTDPFPVPPWGKYTT